MTIEWVLNDYWMTIEWLLNEYWMAIERLLNDYWATIDSLFDHYWIKCLFIKILRDSEANLAKVKFALVNR